MAVSVIEKIVDGLVALLNGWDFAQSFSAEKAFVPIVELPDTENLRVFVVPRGYAEELASRSTSDQDYKVDIGIVKHTKPDDAQGVSDMMVLVGQILDAVRRRSLPGVPEAIWIATENKPIFSPEYLAEKHQFISVVTVSYRVNAVS